MLHKTSGILLNTTEYSESSLIVQLYTQQFGLQSYLVSGTRSKHSKKKASLFQPLTLFDVVVTHSEKKKLNRIIELNVAHPYSTIPYHIVKNMIATFLNEVLYKSLKEANSDETLFEFIKNSLLNLDIRGDNYVNFHLLFMVELSRYLGFYPQIENSNESSIFNLQAGRFETTVPIHPYYLNQQLSLDLKKLLSISYQTLPTLDLDTKTRKKLLHSLVEYYMLHISNFGEMKSLRVLEELML